MTLEELLQRAYGVAMTPLPRSWLPEVDPGAVKAKLASMLPGPVDASGLPQMPAAWAEYARREGLYPEQQQRGGMLQQLQQAPAAAPSGGMWEWLHPQGTGVTRRGFNDIYPGLGR